ATALATGLPLTASPRAVAPYGLTVGGHLLQALPMPVGAAPAGTSHACGRLQLPLAGWRPLMGWLPLQGALDVVVAGPPYKGLGRGQPPLSSLPSLQKCNKNA
ncbi:hypothetical protein B296_00034875, partial [Ensete ventricosum]